MKKLSFCLSILAMAACGNLHGVAIGIGDFSGGEFLTTFDDLGLPFSSPDPLVLDGNTYTTDDGTIRYTDPNTFEADANGEAIGNNTDLGFFDVILGGFYTRVGARIGGSTISYTGIVDFFGVGDVLLGSVAFGNNAGMVFTGWEDNGGITRVRFNDTASNGRILHMDDFRFEDGGNRVPDAGATFAIFGLALASLGFARRLTGKR